MRKSLVLLVLFATACAPKPVPMPPAKLAMPRAALMAPVAKLPPVKPGDSLYEDAAVCRAEYGRIGDRLTGLQGYVLTIHGKKVPRP